MKSVQFRFYEIKSWKKIVFWAVERRQLGDSTRPPSISSSPQLLIMLKFFFLKAIKTFGAWSGEDIVKKMYFVAGPNKSLDFIFMWKYEQRQQWRRFPSNFMFSYGFWSSKLPYHLNTENESFHLARLMVDLLDIEEGGSDTTTTTRRFLVPASWPSPHENVQQHPNSAILTYWVSQVKAVYGLIFELFFSFFDCLLMWTRTLLKNEVVF